MKWSSPVIEMKNVFDTWLFIIIKNGKVIRSVLNRRIIYVFYHDIYNISFKILNHYRKKNVFFDS